MGKGDGQEMLLDLGEDAEDDHGRLLVYVWTAPEDGVIGGVKRVFGAGRSELFNRTLVEEGYADVLTVESNELYEACFERARAALPPTPCSWRTRLFSR
jgi:endonuclease YncB( thermonuclease family)